jgi:hypothetical protein
MVNTKRAEYTILGDVVEFPAGVFITIWLLSTFLSFFSDQSFFLALMLLLSLIIFPE